MLAHLQARFPIVVKGERMCSRGLRLQSLHHEGWKGLNLPG